MAGLVLTRRTGESVVLMGPNDERIRITVTQTIKGSTKLVFEAGREFKIFREELLRGPDDAYTDTDGWE